MTGELHTLIDIVLEKGIFALMFSTYYLLVTAKGKREDFAENPNCCKINDSRF